MKKTFLLTIATALLGVFAFAQGTPNAFPVPPTNNAAPAELQADPNAPVFKWEEELHDFQQIPQGTPATARFYFTNIGKTPLKIDQAKPTCGCTIGNWSKEDIAPGEKGYVEATYNAAAPGQFNKGITVTSNASTPTKMLYLKGEVMKKEDVDFHDNGMLNNGGTAPGQSPAPAPNH